MFSLFYYLPVVNHRIVFYGNNFLFITFSSNQNGFFANAAQSETHTHTPKISPLIAMNDMKMHWPFQP